MLTSNFSTLLHSNAIGIFVFQDVNYLIEYCDNMTQHWLFWLKSQCKTQLVARINANCRTHWSLTLWMPLGAWGYALWVLLKKKIMMIYVAFGRLCNIVSYKRIIRPEGPTQSLLWIDTGNPLGREWGEEAASLRDLTIILRISIWDSRVSVNTLSSSQVERQIWLNLEMYF